MDNARYEVLNFVTTPVTLVLANDLSRGELNCAVSYQTATTLSNCLNIAEPLDSDR
ncbi:MAG: hypothetical protein R3A12_15620 [Ignavibacteria bacterium]